LSSLYFLLHLYSSEEDLSRSYAKLWENPVPESVVLETGYGENRFQELSRNLVWNRVDHVPEMLIFKAGIDFYPLSTAIILIVCWKCIDP